MSAKKVKEIRDIYILSHPIRNDIAKTLIKYEGEGCYPTKIAEELEQKRELISFHLLKLESAGLVEGEYGLKNPEKKTPRAVKYYKLTKNGKMLYKKLEKIL